MPHVEFLTGRTRRTLASGPSRYCQKYRTQSRHMRPQLQNLGKTDHTELTTVSFSRYLVQVRHHSFLGCDNIANLNFSRCQDLLEFSYEVFHMKSGKYNTANSALTSLQLPDCLKYIGVSAFYNFTNVSSFHLSTKTVFIVKRRAKRNIVLGLRCRKRSWNVQLS